MTLYTVYTNAEAHQLLKNNSNVKADDKIEVLPDNQMGYELFKVILDDKGEKQLKIIDSYDIQLMKSHKGGNIVKKSKHNKSKKNQTKSKHNKSKKNQTKSKHNKSKKNQPKSKKIKSHKSRK